MPLSAGKYYVCNKLVINIVYILCICLNSKTFFREKLLIFQDKSFVVYQEIILYYEGVRPA